MEKNIDPSTVEFGTSLPPQGPHTITVHLPGYENAKAIRDGDQSVLAKLKSIYPRFCPFGLSAQLCGTIASKIPSLPEGYGCAAYTSPDVWASNRGFAASPRHREEARMDPAEFKYYVVRINGVRLYVVAFPLAKSGVSMFQWQHGGLGFSTRVAEALLGHDVVYEGEYTFDTEREQLPEPTYFPEGESHALIRERIAGLLMRATAKDHAKRVLAGDVFLYQTGMAAITRLHEAIRGIEGNTGPVVVFGAVFHNSYHVFEESEGGGIKHYGKADEADIDDFEKYLEEKGEVSYVFTEFPSNPIMVSVDLMRLRKLADKYGFILVVDDTVASFANIDLLAAADIILSSLTKSFSGYADVMAGSVVLNPNSEAAYASLKPVLTRNFRNELFEEDVKVLLRNSNDYLERSAVLNRNAAALAKYFHGRKDKITRVWYPPYSPGSGYLGEFMRKKTEEFPEPGYGCLLSVEFDTIEKTKAFYDNVNFFSGPHLGAHLTLALAYNLLAYGKENPEEHAAYGVRQEQVRISVGLEDEDVLISRCEDALSKI
ncbi:cystathionine gamma-synthase [Poronia punctata]|nr:cystathionine gamma-synthase [Poronia punctata]